MFWYNNVIGKTQTKEEQNPITGNGSGSKCLTSHSNNCHCYHILEIKAAIYDQRDFT